jgi:surface polysaccharide O-acyltransferase-like enzyme
MERRQDIDQLRGLAILLMIMVHAAATWAPEGASTTSLFALIIAGLGGLAAPLFVTVGGWVTVQSTWTLQKALTRFAFLLLTQILVNLTAPHLFDPFTPGVLSLFAILYLIAPIWLRIAENIAFCCTVLFGICIINLVLLPGDSSLGWNDRITSNGIEIINHLVLTGTYPVFPWVFFSILGAGINIHSPSIKQLGSIASVGLIICITILLDALQKDVPFAQPSGEAALTFFPANTPFLIGACTGVLILWMALEHRNPYGKLNKLGQLSLTLYVIHFIPIYLGSNFTPEWMYAVPLVLLYTVLWWPIGVFHQERCPRYSLEYLLQRFTNHEEERVP